MHLTPKNQTQIKVLVLDKRAQSLFTGWRKHHRWGSHSPDQTGGKIADIWPGGKVDPRKHILTCSDSSSDIKETIKYSSHADLFQSRSWLDNILIKRRSREGKRFINQGVDR